MDLYCNAKLSGWRAPWAERYGKERTSSRLLICEAIVRDKPDRADAMNLSTVTVFGGTGFLGHEIVQALTNNGWHVRIAARRRREIGPNEPHVESIEADIRDRESVARALEGAEAAVNAVSLYTEHRRLGFEDIHVEGARLLAEEAGKTEVPRLIHISGIGVDSRHPSKYVRARTRGEEAVRRAFSGTTLLRPSVLFGPGDDFLSTLDMVTRLPVVPLFGSGRTLLQPVHAADVARAVAVCLRRPDTLGETYELGGASRHRYREIVEQVLASRGRKRPLLPVPFPVWHGLALLMGILPNAPLTRDQVLLMQSDNVVADDAAGFGALGLQARGLSEALAESLP